MKRKLLIPVVLIAALAAMGAYSMSWFRHRPRRNTNSGGMATGRKTLQRPKPISIARPPTKSARASISSATTPWRRRI